MSRAPGPRQVDRPRCPWALGTPLVRAYHDREWGVPVHDDRRWFEMLVLEGHQAGLSWRTILEKRARYREVFDGFDPRKVAAYGPAKVRALLADAGIVRNRLKVESAITNARAFLEVQRGHGSFDAWIWRQVEGAPITNRWRALRQVPARTGASDALSRELKRLGFRFVGSTICYALMQATGIVNDHLTGCHRHAELSTARGRSRTARPR